MALAMLPEGGIADWAGPLGLIVHHSLLLFAVVNPIGNIPVYVDLTRELEKRERARVMNLAVLTALSVVVVFALIGDWSLAYLFNVNVSELEIAGGILLFIIALRGILAYGAAYEHPKDRVMVAVFPIAFPIMVGPGALTVTIITTQAIGQIPMIFTAVIAFALRVPDRPQCASPDASDRPLRRHDDRQAAVHLPGGQSRRHGPRRRRHLSPADLPSERARLWRVGHLSKWRSSRVAFDAISACSPWPSSGPWSLWIWRPFGLRGGWASRRL